MRTADTVERALTLLRADQEEPRPDPELEARLRARFRPRVRRSFRLLRLIVAGTLLSGAAFAASGGLEWVRGWWFRLEVDGREVSGPLAEDAELRVPFRTRSGETGTVSIRRDRLADGAARTRIDIEGQGPGGATSESAEDVSGGRGPERFPISALDEANPVHDRIDGDGVACAFFVASDGAGGTRLLLLREDGSELPVLEVARIPLDLRAAGVVPRFTEQTDGSLLVSVSAGEDGAFEFLWDAPRASAPGALRLSAHDGSVRVQVEPDDGSR